MTTAYPGYFADLTGKTVINEGATNSLPERKVLTVGGGLVADDYLGTTRIQTADRGIELAPCQWAISEATVTSPVTIECDRIQLGPAAVYGARVLFVGAEPGSREKNGTYAVYSIDTYTVSLVRAADMQTGATFGALCAQVPVLMGPGRGVWTLVMTEPRTIGVVPVTPVPPDGSSQWRWMLGVEDGGLTPALQPPWLVHRTGACSVIYQISGQNPSDWHVRVITGETAVAPTQLVGVTPTYQELARNDSSVDVGAYLSSGTYRLVYEPAVGERYQAVAKANIYWDPYAALIEHHDPQWYVRLGQAETIVTWGGAGYTHNFPGSTTLTAETGTIASTATAGHVSDRGFSLLMTLIPTSTTSSSTRQLLFGRSNSCGLFIRRVAGIDYICFGMIGSTGMLYTDEYPLTGLSTTTLTVLGVADANVPTGRLKLYVNGVVAAMSGEYLSGLVDYPVQHTTGAAITFGAPALTAGTVGDLAIWERALTDADAVNLHYGRFSQLSPIGVIEKEPPV